MNSPPPPPPVFTTTQTKKVKSSPLSDQFLEKLRQKEIGGDIVISENSVAPSGMNWGDILRIMTSTPTTKVLTSFGWDVEHQNWVQELKNLEISNRKILGDDLTFLQYNVYMMPDHSRERMEHLAQLLCEHNVDIATFQEMTQIHLFYLLQIPFIREHYFVSDSTGITLGEPERGVTHGVVVFSRFPIEEVMLHGMPTKQGRWALIAKIGKTTGSGPPLVVATAHLESDATDIAIRRQQLRTILSHLWAEEDVAVLLDTNFTEPSEPKILTGRSEDDTVADGTVADGTYVDVWSAIGKGKGWTFDNQRNPFIEWSQQSRLDRMYLRSQRWTVGSVTIVGDTPVPGLKDIFISDHFGLVVKLCRK